jgi:phosphocarrier protein FPr
MSTPPTRTLVLRAPLSGPVIPIEEVPDPVFAQKLVGDGVSIDPTSHRLLSPCDATVSQVHRAGHAVNLQTEEGIELILHIGLDTVELKGEGFLPLVRAGDRVRAGQALVDFAPDYVATHARSLLTEVVVSNPERAASIRRHLGTVVAGRDPILELTLTAAAAASDAAGGELVLSGPVLVRSPSGLHARPAALLVAAARGFRSELKLRRGEREANARSITSIMTLEVQQGDQVEVAASGPDAAEAVAALRALLEAEGHEEPAPVAARAPVEDVGAIDESCLRGVPAAPGLALGPAFQLRRDDVAVAETGGEPRAERQRLEEALGHARLQLAALQARLSAEPARAAIFAAHAELLDDPDLLPVAWTLIEQGKGAAFAWHEAFTRQATQLAALRSELLAARAADLRDVGRRVLRLLAGATAEEPTAPAGSVVVAEDLSPSEMAAFERTRVAALCTVTGGATSHVAILARSLDLPLVAGIEARALQVEDGTLLIVDGGRGVVRVAPTAEEVALLRTQLERQAQRRRADSATAHLQARTRDGQRVEVVANIGGLAEARRALEQGAEGVGLLRSEFLFLERASAPSEDEQCETYRSIAEALGPDRPLVVRTLDVGGDKPLPYLPLGHEENPFLGVRGLRIALDHEDVLRTQLRAILRASPKGKLSVMLPMVATLAEFRRAKAVFEEERARLGVAPVPLGIMVEVPAAALMADVFAREADFFSVGTNDLTQYTLAMDRGHPRLAPQIDALSPSVLRLIEMAARAAHAHGRWIGVCGGLAGDPQAVPILLGLGIDELSVSVPAIPAVKAQVRELELPACQELARRALLAESAQAVRELVRS